METATDIWQAIGWFWLAIVVFAAFALVMFAVVLRFGPRRGYWNQPAARLRRPGRSVALVLYAVAAVHVIAGIAAIAAPGVGAGALVVAAVVALFYVACAHVWGIAGAVGERLPWLRDPYAAGDGPTSED